MNPKILKEIQENVYDWEFCASFPNIRCMVKRPVGVLVSYIDELGDEVEKDLRDFDARVFLHELDHINGRTMTHWRISEGNIDVIDSHKEKYPNLVTTVDFYKERVQEATQEFKDQEMFKDDRKHVEVTDTDGVKWKEFKPELREDIYKITGMTKDLQPTFEETMLMDTIKAMRRDRRSQK